MSDIGINNLFSEDKGENTELGEKVIQTIIQPQPEPPPVKR